MTIIENYQTRLFLHYSSIVTRTAMEKELVTKLDEDPRVIALKGKMLSRGNCAETFQTHNLAMWFLWYANENGLNQAVSKLELFLNAETVPILNTLWLLGVFVEEPIELRTGYTIQPARCMPDSQEKEFFLQTRFGQQPPHDHIPATAITKSCPVMKVRNDDDKSSEQDKEFWQAWHMLGDIALLLNTLHRCLEAGPCTMCFLSE